MTIVSINQPAYLPWLGYFDRIIKSDVHIVLDHVPVGKDAMTNRNKIRTPDGFQLLTVPINRRGSNDPISHIEIANDPHWRKKHIKAIKQNYARAPYYDVHIGTLEKIYEQDWDSLDLLITEITQYMFFCFQINTPTVSSSYMEARGTKSDLNLNLCLEAGAKTYLSGPFGRDYLDIEKFKQHGIEVKFQDYAHPVYKQCWSGDFQPYMSALDALMNCKEFPR